MIRYLISKRECTPWLLLVLASTFSPHTISETTECTEITSVPTVIAQQGVYCFKQNLATSISTGAAIDIQTNNVTIDFNGFKLGGLGAGAATQAFGVYADNRLNITLRHGNIRGFYLGAHLEGVLGGGHLIEDSLFDGNRQQGIQVQGEGNLLRNNRVVNTGSSSITDQATGIVVNGPGATVINNDVYGTVAEGAGNAYGIYVTQIGDGSVVQGNRIQETVTIGSGNIWAGIRNSGGNVLIRRNMIVNSSYLGYAGVSVTGLSSDPAFAYCVENIVLNFSFPNDKDSCTDGGGNSF